MCPICRRTYRVDHPLTHNFERKEADVWMRRRFRLYAHPTPSNELLIAIIRFFSHTQSVRFIAAKWFGGMVSTSVLSN